MKVTLGGNRVGSGKKMQAQLHNYYRSTHNLSQKWASSMASGVLYPALVLPATRGDSFNIDINADCRTVPTLTPLFGSYKMQIDVYQCPIRLYQGLLHNNPLAIGLKMSQVKFPRIKLRNETTKLEDCKIHETALLKYLGLSGMGTPIVSQSFASRDFNALPVLSYYDIYKTYYANKQEEKAYIIGTTIEDVVSEILYATANYQGQDLKIEFDQYYDVRLGQKNTIYLHVGDANKFIEKCGNEDIISLSAHDLGGSDTWSYNQLINNETVSLYYDISAKKVDQETIKIEVTFYNTSECRIKIWETVITTEQTQKLKILPFNLTNIDDMRYDLLSSHELGVPFVIEKDETADYLPYSQIVATDLNDAQCNKYPMNGLAIKTYQNDIFNNWLRAEWIEGENSINALSSVSVENGKFSMDALSFAEKLYNMLNRIALAGATYEDWQDAVYETVKRRQIESPIFVGGMSQEVVFDEIVQTAPGDGTQDGTGTLGTLGGRGRLLGNKKGGKIHIKCDEACFIMAIVSLTPRIYYTQGNEFYMTELESMDDLHKPAMDGIGFQDLVGERLAWWDTKLAGSLINHRSKVGKLPAWIEYMTAVDKAYGDFALENGMQSMTLNRNYEMSAEGGIKDATTYIDPSKYNYAFAYTNLDAQNFWVQINWDIEARRLMSARLIPNV